MYTYNETNHIFKRVISTEISTFPTDFTIFYY